MGDIGQLCQGQGLNTPHLALLLGVHGWGNRPAPLPTLTLTHVDSTGTLGNPESYCTYALSHKIYSFAVPGEECGDTTVLVPLSACGVLLSVNELPAMGL